MADEPPERAAESAAPLVMPRYASFALIGLFAGSLALGGFAIMLGTQSEVFRFIALLIIFITALAASAAVFVGLHMGNKAEAFGLPSGSVRALLAIGIMILFVVFGLPAVSPPTAEPLPPREVAVPAAQLEGAVRLHRDQGLNVRILSYGAAAAPAVGTAAAIPAVPGRIEVSGRPSLRSIAENDLAKQMLTAIITLLTTVVGFYFGARSASESFRDIAGGAAGPNANPPAAPRTPDGGAAAAPASSSSPAVT